MSRAFYAELSETLEEIREEGLYKTERLITGEQDASIRVGGKDVLNFCANNYLGLADSPELVAAAKTALDEHGFGMASVRFICGTQGQHRELEKSLADWLGFEDSILYAACFDANGGVFEPLLGPEDAIISDSLNHASIIDGIRLCKAKRFRYANNDMADLEAKLIEAKDGGARRIMIATDGVFSMDGTIAKLDEIVALKKKYDALLMVDDCHSTGFLGDGGRGTAAFCAITRISCKKKMIFSDSFGSRSPVVPRRNHLRRKVLPLYRSMRQVTKKRLRGKTVATLPYTRRLYRQRTFLECTMYLWKCCERRHCPTRTACS